MSNVVQSCNPPVGAYTPKFDIIEKRHINLVDLAKTATNFNNAGFHFKPILLRADDSESSPKPRRTNHYPNLSNF